MASVGAQGQTAASVPRLLLLLGLAVAPAVPLPRAPVAHASQPAHPDVVLIVVDTLRADRFDALLRAGRLPFLRRLAARSTRFTRVWSSSSWTPTATASIFTGLHPHQHGVRSGYLALEGGRRLVPVDRIPDELTTLPMVLQAAGYRTLGVSDNVNIGETMGFTRGFSEFSQHGYAGAAKLSRTAARLWRARRAADVRPTFLYLHPMDPHAPYHRRRGYVAPQGPGGSDARSRYDSEIVHLDGHLRRLARKCGWDHRTLIVFTSDHGEAFGEHGQHGHPNQLYDELLAVPLLIAAPHQGSAVVVDEPVGVVDILPTLRALLGLPPEPRDVGVDLRAATGGVLAERALLAMRFSDFVSPPLARKALLWGDHKLIVSGAERRELYDLAGDPQERHDLARAQPQRVQRLVARLAALEGAGQRFAATRVAVPDEPPAGDGASLRARLRALGYVQ